MKKYNHAHNHLPFLWILRVLLQTLKTLSAVNTPSRRKRCVQCVQGCLSTTTSTNGYCLGGTRRASKMHPGPPTFTLATALLNHHPVHSHHHPLDHPSMLTKYLLMTPFHFEGAIAAAAADTANAARASGVAAVTPAIAGRPAAHGDNTNVKGYAVWVSEIMLQQTQVSCICISPTPPPLPSPPTTTPPPPPLLRYRSFKKFDATHGHVYACGQRKILHTPPSFA